MESAPENGTVVLGAGVSLMKRPAKTKRRLRACAATRPNALLVAGRGEWLAAATALLAGSLQAGCAAPWSVKAAQSGDLLGLQAAMAEDKARGRLDQKRVADVAKAVAEREILKTTGSEALARIDEARGCFRPLVGSLEDRSRRSDDAAAGAMLALLDGRPNGSGDEALLRKHAASTNPLWRAVAARAAVGSKLGNARRQFYVDPDERVRLAALRAALEKPDSADASALLEVVRLDPNSVAQAIAARATGGLESADVVLALRDRYTTADEGLRQSIVDAWSRPALAKAGGRRELILVAENERGAYAIEAGAMLLQMDGDAEARAIGKRTLLRAIGDGLSRDRVLAIGRAPIAEREVIQALRSAARDADVPVKVAAWKRLTDVAETRIEAWGELRKLAETGVRDALFALARAGDPAALERVAKEMMSSTDSEARLSAMNVLIAAGRFATAAHLLADANAGVRMRASCAVLSVRAR
jgi:hypothetical protein